MMRFKLLIISLLIVNSLTAQHSLTITVYDDMGNSLPGASVYLSGGLNPSVSDQYGVVHFQYLKSGNYSINCTFLGFKSSKTSIEIKTDSEQKIVLQPSEYLTDEVVVSAISAQNNSPFAYTNISKNELDKSNLAQDIPYLLELTPSVVTMSDAGTGIGYTQMRIRGTDVSRINVTTNGIPLNDAESHGVWWVDLPDIAASTQRIQVQRGVGTSTNGAGVFGASINLQTNSLDSNYYAEIKSTAGSFNTFKNSVAVGTGRLKNGLAVDARVSKINSDGYIDRAFTNMYSWFASLSYANKKNLLRFNVFSGYQETYQAWYGVEKATMDTNRTYNPYKYENQIDHYEQTHYQLLYSRQMSSAWELNTALHLTTGYGYYEEYQEGDSFANYGLSDLIIGNDTITTTNCVRRKIMDNDFFGYTASLIYKQPKFDVIIGTAANQYFGNHYGKMIQSDYQASILLPHQWYENQGDKKDANLFAKMNYNLTSQLNFYADFQIRYLQYKIEGIDDNFSKLDTKNNYLFFNPKMGFLFQINNESDVYLSAAVANREPSRTDIIDAPLSKKPTHEQLFDVEFGYKIHSYHWNFMVNFYRMEYKNQLVQTGKLNDVGAAININVDKSYRTGIEISGSLLLFNWLVFNGNITLSSNKIVDFTQWSDYYDTDYNYLGNQPKSLGNTDISYSPSIISSASILIKPYKTVDIIFTEKYVGKQYFDNTMNEERSMDAYLVTNARIDWKIPIKFAENLTLQLLINNLMDLKYYNNAYGGNWYENNEEKNWAYYFPQAGRHFLAGITLKF